MTEAFGCVANTIRLRSGRSFDFANPQPDQFTFDDIAGALSKICRFGSQINWFYTVAEHSVLCCEVSQYDGKTLAIQAAVLMHDAAEAFCGDVVKPLKVMLPDYSVIEKRVESAIAEKFGIDFESNREYIREVDNAWLIREHKTLFGRDSGAWTGQNDARDLSDFEVQAWGPGTAEHRFDWEARRVGIDINK